MNYKSMGYILGWIIKVESAFMMLPVLTAVLYREEVWIDYLLCAAGAFFLATWMTRSKPERKGFYAKEGFVTVALGWIVLSLIGALPLWVSGEIPQFTDALFEIVSGFTTTGASILPQVECMSRATLMWRSVSHWIGGMGVLVFVLAIMPLAGGGESMHLMRAESPGPSVSKLVPKLRSTAKYLYGIYIAITAVELLLLMAGGMKLFDALCISFATAGTGGFGIHNDSIASYSTYTQIVITIFMMLFGVNFSAYFLILARRAKEALRIEEVRWYFIIYGVVTLLITFNITKHSGEFFNQLLHAAFQAASIMTTTGFATQDFNVWPEFSKMLLVTLMFIGACAGSTGGGIKVSRILIYFKTIRKEINYLAHPRSIRVIQMDGKRVEHTVVRATNVFLVAYLGIFVMSFVLLSIGNYDFATNFTAVAATMNNIGPGLEMVGPAENFAFFSHFSKYVLIFDMLAGRLEIFPMLVLLTPATWKK